MTNKRLYLEKLVCVVLLMACVASLMVGCVGDDKSDTPTNNENKDACIPNPISLAYSVKDADRTFSVDEEVVIELYYGTRLTREELINETTQEYDWTTIFKNYAIYATRFEKNVTSRDIASEMRRDRDCAFNNVSYNSNMVICNIDDFCAEKYPYIESHNQREPHPVILPKELFVGDEGAIIIWCLYKGYVHECKLCYTKNEDSIIIDKATAQYNGEIEYEK